MKFKIAIVEDDSRSAEALKSYIERYTRETNKDFSIEHFTDGAAITENYKSQFDIIFLDIEMPHVNGMETATFIRELDESVIIIFVTNMAQYALQGYSVSPQHYLLKPVTYPQIAAELDKAVNKISQIKSRYMLFATDNGTRKIDVEDIIYIESEKHNMKFHLRGNNSADEELCVWSSLTKLLKDLENYNFVRCSKYCIVNLNYVKSINTNELDLGTAKMLIGRIYKKEFLNKLFEYTRTLG